MKRKLDNEDQCHAVLREFSLNDGYLHDEYREVLVEVRHFVHEGLHRQ